MYFSPAAGPYPWYIDSKITDRIWPSSPHPAREGARAVPGRISGDEPRLVLLRDLPLEWTVGISPRGRGNPSPRAKRHPTVLLRQPPPGGEGSHGDISWEAVPRERCRSRFPGRRGEWARIRFFPGSPRAPDRGGYRPGGGAVRGDTGDKPSPGRQPPDSVRKDQYTPPVRVSVIGNRCTSALIPNYRTYLVLVSPPDGAGAGSGSSPGSSPAVDRGGYRHGGRG